MLSWVFQHAALLGPRYRAAPVAEPPPDAAEGADVTGRPDVLTPAPGRLSASPAQDRPGNRGPAVARRTRRD
jgi:hypothetical protein